jgi:hypothetical protein
MKPYPLMLRAGSILILTLVLVGGSVVSAATGTAVGPWSVGKHGVGTTSMMASQHPTGLMSWENNVPASRTMLTIGQAVQRVQRYAARYGNPNLVVDEVLEFQRNFYAIVKDTSTGHGAFEVVVNKWTGAIFPEYGPAMMWNMQYGMMTGGMGGMMGYQRSRGPMTVSPQQARQIAQRWLNQNRPESTTEAPDQFPGYYTIHFHKNGKIAGMLSVNGYSGRVWYHNWHGTFIRMKVVAG